MRDAFENSPIFSIRHYEELSKGLFEARVSHRELQERLEGTYTIEQLNQVLRDEKDEPPKDNFLAGGYVLLTTYASVRFDTLADNSDETPTAVIAVEKDYLTSFAINEGFDSLQEFLDEYIYDSVPLLANLAEAMDALGFAYAESADKQFYFPETNKGSAMLAFADFLSGKLQEQDFEDASKAIDAMLDL